MAEPIGGRWEIIRNLDRGGQANTHLVKDVTGTIEDVCVLKRIHSYKKPKPRAIQRMKREIKALIELEHENIIAALEWVRNDVDKRLRLAGVLGWFWFEHSHYNLGVEYLKDVDVNATEVDLTKLRAMTSYGWLLSWMGDPKDFSIFENSIKLWDELKNIREKAKFLYYYSFSKSAMADYTVAQDAATEIYNVARELKDDYLLLKSRMAQTIVHI